MKKHYEFKYPLSIWGYLRILLGLEPWWHKNLRLNAALWLLVWIMLATLFRASPTGVAYFIGFMIVGRSVYHRRIGLLASEEACGVVNMFMVPLITLAFWATTGFRPFYEEAFVQNISHTIILATDLSDGVGVELFLLSNFLTWLLLCLGFCMVLLVPWTAVLGIQRQEEYDPQQELKIPDWAKDGPDNYPWYKWQLRATAAGVRFDLVKLGCNVYRESYCWNDNLKEECGWSDNGKAMLNFALHYPDQALKRWQQLYRILGPA